MPLEALREPVTPVGLHYLLIHYDIPQVDASSWRLTVDGRSTASSRSISTTLRARPTAELASTMECAGNGRARLEPRPVSQPWLLEAVGTGRWRGTSLRRLLTRPASPSGAVEVLFTGLDRGIENGEEQSFQRSLPVAEALRGRGPARLRPERRAAAAPARLPAAPARAGLVRHDERQVALADHRAR